MEKGFVTSEIKNNISEITFGTPKSNSLPGEILEKLAKTILDEAAKEEVKAILLKSEGEKAFCAGASFDELLAINDLETSKTFFGGFAKVLNAMRTCRKIVVVRVQGKTTAEMDAEVAQFLEKLASRSSDALALIKKVSWEGTEHFAELSPERIHMSASLILEDTAKKNIEKIKENLRAK